MPRVLNIIIAAALLLGVAALIVVPKLKGDDADKAKTQTVQVAGIGSEDKEAFFSDPKVVAALRSHNIKVDYELIGDRQLAHELRFGSYGFVWPGSQEDVDTVVDNERTAERVELFATQEVVAAYKSEADAMIAAGFASLDATTGVYRFDTLAYNRAVAAAAYTKLPDASEDADAMANFASGDVNAVRTTEQMAIMAAKKDMVVLYPQPAVELSLPMLTLTDGGVKLADALRTDDKLQKLQIIYGYRTDDDKAFAASAKALGITVA